MDAGRDAGADAGMDAGPTTCCTDWRFERRVLVEGFGDEQTVTPRLIELEHAPAVVVTGPSDSVGPSGAHLVRFSRDLATQSTPVAVTTGSFTWGQAASSGDRFAVCWGTGGGRNVARLYDSAGAPVSEIITLDESVRSPCVDAAFYGGQFAFVYAMLSPETVNFARVRLLDAATSTVGALFDVSAYDDTPSTSIVGTADGLMVAVANPLARSGTELRSLDRPGIGALVGPARRVYLAQGREGLNVLRIVEQSISLTHTADLWLLQSFDPVTMRPLSDERELARFEPPSSPLFDATSDACGIPMLGTSTPSLMRVEPSGLVEFMPDAPPDPSYGDTSVLVLGTDAYVAFSANSPSPNPQVHVDHYVCIEE